MRALLGALLVISLYLAGCAGPGPEDPDDGNTTDGTDGSDGSPTPTPTATGDDSAPPPPKEQRVDDPDEVDRPGEYAVLPRASDHKDEEWAVPEWKVGDSWRYEHQVHAAAGGVSVEVTDEVSGTGTTMETAVYRLTRTEHDCKADGDDCVRRLNFTQDDLVEIEANGYMEHVFVFPLEDGKRWVYARSDGRNDASKVNAEARHVPDYLWPGTTKQVEAWRIILDYEGEGNVEQRYWLGVDQKNVLRREIWADSEAGVPQMVFTTTLKSYSPA